jgi:hypothetical protein
MPFYKKAFMFMLAHFETWTFLKKPPFARFEVSTVLLMKVPVLWDVALFIA